MSFAPGAASGASDTLIVDGDFNENNPDNDGDHKFDDLQSAVDNAEIGDKIVVRETSNAEPDYSQNVVVDKQVVIEGNSSDVSIQGTDPANATLQLGADGIELRNMRVLAPDASTDNSGAEALLIKDVINTSYVQDVVVENNVFVGDAETGALARATVAPDAQQLARRLTIRNNEFMGGSNEDQMEYGLVLDAAKSTVANNTFSVKADVASVVVDGPENELTNNVINYPGYGWSGLWITGQGTSTMVDGLSVDGHMDTHIHHNQHRGDWLKFGVYVEGSGSTLSNVDVVQTHIGIQIGGDEVDEGGEGERVTDVTLLDSMGDKNRNHDLKIADNALRTTVKTFDAKSAVMGQETYTNFSGPQPTSGANVYVNDDNTLDDDQDAVESHHLEDIESTSDSPIGIRLETEDSTILDSHLANKGGGPVDLEDEEAQSNNIEEDPEEPIEPQTTGISLVGAHNNVIQHNLVENNDDGIAIVFGFGNQILDHNPTSTGEGAEAGIYNNSDDGIELSVAPNTHIENNDIRRNGVGLNVFLSQDVRAMYNNFVDNGEGIVVSDTVSAPVDARWNWFGAKNGPSGPGTDGVLSGSGDSIVAPNKDTVVYDPFLTAPKDQVEQDPDKTVQFGHDLVTNGSQGVQTFATPGPANVSLQVTDQDAMVWTYDDGGFSMVTGTQVTGAETLRAWGISDLAHDEHARVVIDFTDSPRTTPGAEDLESGWNFVASPQYGNAEDTIRTTTTVLRVGQAYDQFDSQPMPSSAPTVTTMPFNYPMGSSTPAPNLSAYAGYWVYVDGSGQITATIPAGVTISEEGGLIVA